MSIFKKGSIFTMGGKEYEVLEEGNEDPSSCLLYIPRHEKETSDPLTIRMWKAEAKLARGDILLHETTPGTRANAFYPPITDPLEQIAELKKRIQSIENRRLTLFKNLDPTGQVLIQDNIVRPNRPFDIWDFTHNKKNTRLPIQYIKMRGIILTISAKGSQKEHFLFNISDQLQPCCKIMGDRLASEGVIKLDLSSELKTIQGIKTDILNKAPAGKIEIEIEVRLDCKFANGMTTLNANILRCSHILEVKAPSVRIGQLAFPEIGDHAITILGFCVDIYTTGIQGLSPSQMAPEF